MTAWSRNNAGSLLGAFPRPALFSRSQDLALLHLEQFKEEAMEKQLQQVENMGGPVTPHATSMARWRPFGWSDAATKEAKAPHGPER